MTTLDTVLVSMTTSVIVTLLYSFVGVLWAPRAPTPKRIQEVQRALERANWTAAVGAGTPPSAPVPPVE